MAMFTYPCPDCGTENAIHQPGCEYEDTDIQQIRKAYIDVIAPLLDQNATLAAFDAPPGISFETLREKVNEALTSDQIPPAHRGMWRDIHTDCLHTLKDYGRVGEAEEMGGLYMRTPEERAQDIIPTFDPMQTIYEYGPVDGAKDYAVYSMVSWCELVGLSWEQTHNFIHEWLTETDAWDDLRWGERSIRQLVDSKQHVYDRELGWGDYASIAAGHVRQSDRSDETRINVNDKLGDVSPGDYDDANYTRTSDTE